MIGEHSDHRTNLQDCVVRSLAIQELSGEEQTSVRVGWHCSGTTAQPLQLVTIFSCVIGLGLTRSAMAPLFRHGLGSLAIRENPIDVFPGVRRFLGEEDG